MLKYHHGSEAYDVALSSAAKAMRDKLHRQIEGGRANGQRAIEKILTEAPEDQIVPADKFQFFVTEDKKIKAAYRDTVKGYSRDIHKHALGQMTEQVHLPKPFQSYLLEQDKWGHDLLAYNLTELYSHLDSRHLVRSVDGEIRGFLSTKYQRRHPGLMLEAFVKACQSVNAVPYEAYAGPTKFMVKSVIANVIEPIQDEVLALGVVIHESPYGNGATEISPFIERMWCTNKAITTTELRKVHIGSRLTDNIAWSEATYQKDTEAMCSQITDLVGGQLGKEAIEKLTETVVRANIENVDPNKFEGFLKKALVKSDAEEVIAKYTSADIENLPQGANIWRASNALSWFAGQIKDEEQAFEVQKLAGLVLSKPEILGRV